MRRLVANPYLVCNKCRCWVTVVPDSLILIPCEHMKGYENVCPSWGPVHGCTCDIVLGAVWHQVPTEIAEGQLL